MFRPAATFRIPKSIRNSPTSSPSSTRCAITRCSSRRASERSILVGDLNVAPLEHDVWSHKQMLRVVSHTPIECEKLVAAQNAGGWVDSMRQHTPEPAKLYTWWSYRAPDWATADKGRRLDHIWTSPMLADRVSGIGIAKDLSRRRAAFRPCAGHGDDRSVSCGRCVPDARMRTAARGGPDAFIEEILDSLSQVAGALARTRPHRADVHRRSADLRHHSARRRRHDAGFRSGRDVHFVRARHAGGDVTQPFRRRSRVACRRADPGRRPRPCRASFGADRMAEPRRRACSRSRP